jgi:hypothetical protein
MINETITLNKRGNRYGNIICVDFIKTSLNCIPNKIKVSVSDQPQEGFTKAIITRYLTDDDIYGVSINDDKHATIINLDELIIKTFGEDVTHFYFKINEA